MQRITDKIIVLIEVTEGMNKPYFLKKEGSFKGVYIRLGRSTVRANEEMITEIQWNTRGISFDTMPVYQANEDDLDKTKINDFLSSRKNASKAKLEDALPAYCITTKDQAHIYPTVGGMLLFGKNPQTFYPEARIMCNHFQGVSIGSEVIASRECMGTLDEQFGAACNFIFGCLNKSWKIVGMHRIESLEVLEQSIRAMVMNAVIHRKYHMPSPTKIAIFDNRIEIFSPGVFPRPLDKNLRAGFTHLRNGTICKIFREMGLIENFGLGFITTFAGYEKAGLKAPEVIEGDHWIKCILPRRVPENLLAATKSPDHNLNTALPTKPKFFQRLMIRIMQLLRRR
jgi:ATP-dependent DNA helicase RecG